ncbi:hypothetical protein RJ639_011700 [Escallonia herrerae]|uniref:EF-hand domain-containing protein n=1 Tax=Escallonia herrerae TaxID=1293975 RepID=A0AA88VJZ8_9ASTE|nr:hypothetical protein RJ639_011700 [Escallonia herrerae]
MSSSSFLDFRYGISRKLSRKPASQFSIAKERQRSSVPRVFKPNVEEMKRVFDKFDANKDGKISREEYNLAVGAFGRGKGKIEAFTGFDNDGFIDFEGFMKLHNMDGGVKTSDIQSTFRVFDLDGNGTISADELLEGRNQTCLRLNDNPKKGVLLLSCSLASSIAISSYGQTYGDG